MDRMGDFKVLLTGFWGSIFGAENRCFSHLKNRPFFICVEQNIICCL